MTKYFAVLGALCPASVSLIAVLTATPILAAPAADDPPAGAASTDTNAVGAAVKRDANAVAKAAKDAAHRVAGAAKDVAHKVAAASKEAGSGSSALTRHPPVNHRNWSIARFRAMPSSGSYETAI